MTERQLLEFLKSRLSYFGTEQSEAQARLLDRSYVKSEAAFSWRVTQTITRLRAWHTT